MPVVGNGRLYLFWPDFSIADNPNSTTTSTTLVETDPERADELRDEMAAHQQRIDEIDELLADPLVDSPDFKGDEDALEAERAGHVADIDDLNESWTT